MATDSLVPILWQGVYNNRSDVGMMRQIKIAV